MRIEEQKRELMRAIQAYANEGTHGLPAHQLMTIVDQLASELESTDEFDQWLRQTLGSLVKNEIQRFSTSWLNGSPRPGETVRGILSKQEIEELRKHCDRGLDKSP